MHEYSIALELLRSIEAAAAPYEAATVQRVHLRIGELAGVEAELLSSAFESLFDSDCQLCGKPIETGAPLRCPKCEVPARMDSGDEIMLERLEMEVD